MPNAISFYASYFHERTARHMCGDGSIDLDNPLLASSVLGKLIDVHNHIGDANDEDSTFDSNIKASNISQLVRYPWLAPSLQLTNCVISVS